MINSTGNAPKPAELAALLDKVRTWTVFSVIAHFTGGKQAGVDLALSVLLRKSCYIILSYANHYL